jgi:hypothetical protein
MPTISDLANTTSSSSADATSSRSCFRMKYGKAFFEIDLAALPEHIDHAKQLIGVVIDKMKRRSRALVSSFPNTADPTANSLRLSGNPPAFNGRQKWSYAASANLCIGVMPPSAMFGRSWLYVQSQRVADS